MTTPPDDAPKNGTTTDWYIRHRLAVTVAVYAIIFTASLLAAFGLAYNFHAIAIWLPHLFPPLVALAVPVKLIVFGKMKQYRGSWRYFGLHDLIGIVYASWGGSLIFIIAYFIVENVWLWAFGHRLIDRIPESPMRQAVLLLDFAGTIGLVCFCRVLARLYHEEVYAPSREHLRRVLIVGAKDTGEALLREILRMPQMGYHVVGFLDDDPAELNRTIHGTEVLGTLDDIKTICDRHTIDEILIALPKATPREIRRVIEICQGHNLLFRIVPAVADLIEGRLHVNQLREVDIEDLLGRDPVQLDAAAIARELSQKRIVVTGAGGSIGSQMCRQIARFAPQRLVLIEQAENNLFEIERALRTEFPDLSIVPYVADICDQARIRSIFDREKPATIFHAAAHKHVPMMEVNPGEAVKNNVGGTKTVADAAARIGAYKMVVISTDKAVNPTSIMGCTKRVAEMYVQNLGDETKTQFVTVRFGNVLGSSGSVVPIFRRQIAAGGPVTVTHPDMTRYFMTIAEAAQLVLQAGAMGEGGEIYLLDMGEPVKIVDLARDMITLSGLRPDVDIEIVFTGTRPGEKLFEELSISGEHVARTNHPKIGIWRHREIDADALSNQIATLLLNADRGNVDSLKSALNRLVPEYTNGPAGEHISQPAPDAGARAPSTVKPS